MQLDVELSIRRNSDVTQAKADDFLYELKRREWDRMEQLQAPDKNLEKYKVIAKNVLNANGSTDKIVNLDYWNGLNLKAKADFWRGVSTMDTTLMTTAKGTLDSAQMKKYSSLSSSFDTKLDQINDEIIRISVASVVYKGNDAVENALAGRISELNESLIKVNASKQTALSLSDNPLKQLAQNIYNNKARMWSWQIKAESPQAMDSLTEATKKQLDKLSAIFKTIDNLTNKSLDEHIIPRFNIDVQNLKVVKARDQVWTAIEEGDKSKAEYYFMQGKMPLYNGATLDIQRMVPDLTMINWPAKSWLREQQALVDKYNEEVKSADILSMQQALKKLGLYEGAETGKYDVDFLGDVVYFQQLIALRVVEPAPPQGIAIDGKVTTALIDAAKKAEIVNTNEIISNFGFEMMNAIRKGRQERQIDSANEIVDLAERLNPFGSRFYSETLPGMSKLLTAMATGQIKKEDIINSMVDSLVKEYIEPINQMFTFAVDVAKKKATYGESKQFGYNLQKMIEAIAMACASAGIGTAVAKIAPKFAEGILDLGKKLIKRAEQADEVVKGSPGANLPIDEFDDSQIYEDALMVRSV